MNWVWFAFAAALVYSVVNLFEKHVLDKELHDPALAAFVAGASSFVLFGVASLAVGVTQAPVRTGWGIALASALGVLGILLYYEGIRREEVSRCVAMLTAEPLFASILAAVVLRERYADWQYLGVVLLVIGAVLLSTKRISHAFTFRKGGLLALGGALVFGIRNVMMKLFAAGNVLGNLIWLGLGGLIAAVLILLFHHPHLRRQARKGIRHLVALNVALTAGFFLFLYAITAGPVGLASAILQVRPAIVFVAATFLSILAPNFIREQISWQILLVKTTAIALTIVGILLIL